MTRTRLVVLLLVAAAVTACLALVLLPGTPGSSDPGARGGPVGAEQGVPALRGSRTGGAEPGDAALGAGGSVTVSIAIEPTGTTVRWIARLFDHDQWHLRGGAVDPTDERRGEGTGTAVLQVAESGRYLLVVTPLELRWQEHVGPIRLGPGIHLDRRIVFLAPARIAGSVTDLAGAVFPAVTVHLRPRHRVMDGEDWSSPEADDHLLAETDENGAFLFVDLDPARDYDLGVVVPGYVPARHLGVRVRPAREKHVDLLLEPAAAIEGVLLDPEGHPLSGVKIEARRVVRQTEALMQWGNEGTATTSADGSFHLDALEAGRKQLFAVVTYEAGLTEVAQWIGEVPAGRVTNIGPWRVLSGEVRVQLLRANGTPPSASRIHVGLVESDESDESDIDEVWMLYVFPGEDGLGRVRGLPPGRLILRAVDMSPNEAASRPRREEIPYPGGDFECEIQFDPPGAPTGPEDEIAIEIECRDAEGGSLLVVTADREVIAARSWSRKAGDDYGHKTLCRPAGTKAIALLVSGGRYIEKEILFDETAARHLTLAPLNEGGRLTVVVVRAGRGVASRLLALRLPGWEDELGTLLGRTDRQGRFVLDGLPTDREWEVGLVNGPRVPVVWAGDEGRAEIVLED